MKFTTSLLLLATPALTINASSAHDGRSTIDPALVPTVVNMTDANAVFQALEPRESDRCYGPNCNHKQDNGAGQLNIERMEMLWMGVMLAVFVGGGVFGA